MDKDLSFLSERQRTVYEARISGKTFRQIGNDLGVSGSMARSHFLKAERRIREHTEYLDTKEKNKTPVTLTVTLGELSLIIDAVSHYIYDIRRKAERTIRMDLREHAPCKYDDLEAIKNRFNSIYKTERKKVFK